MIVVSLVLLAFAGWFGHRQYIIVHSWPPVEGVVTKSRAVTHGSFDRSHGGSSTMYTTEVEFRYTVDGNECVATTTPGYDSSSRAEMENLAQAFAPSTRHTIRYNPVQPHEIRMNAGYNFGFFAPALIAGGLGVLFLGVVGPPPRHDTVKGPLGDAGARPIRGGVWHGTGRSACATTVRAPAFDGHGESRSVRGAR
jgi:hypothetical protein